jgi:hypothetical protein
MDNWNGIIIGIMIAIISYSGVTWENIHAFIYSLD